MLRSLTRNFITSGRTNLVVFDSPVPLDTARHWSADRTWGDHLNRVEEVIRHYREKLGVPVFLMGHSMGSISVTEMARRLQGKNADDLIADLISSGGNNAIHLNYSTIRFPVLVLHHEQDQCPGNFVGHAKRLHSNLVEGGNTRAELVVIGGGVSMGDPCRSGYHMYPGATEDVSAAIDRFIAKNLPR